MALVREIAMYAGITIMNFPPKRTADVYSHIRDVLVPFHSDMRSQGIKDALFLVNPESCQGIGIAIWDQPQQLQAIEKGTSRSMARSMRDSATAPTEYTKLRAQWVEDLGGGIVSTDWYDLAGNFNTTARLFASAPSYAGITIMNFPSKRTQDVYRHIREVLVPTHAQFESQGLTDALFLVNPEGCQGIGIAVWNSADKLRQMEKGTSREMARAMRDPHLAPTDYTKLRAQWVEDLGGGIVSTDWYQLVGRVPPTADAQPSPSAPPASPPVTPPPQSTDATSGSSQTSNSWLS
jgi:hypothetical protein